MMTRVEEAFKAIRSGVIHVSEFTLEELEELVEMILDGGTSDPQRGSLEDRGFLAGTRRRCFVYEPDEHSRAMLGYGVDRLMLTHLAGGNSASKWAKLIHGRDLLISD